MGIFIRKYAIHVSDDNRAHVEEAIRSFNGEITILENLPDKIRFETDDISAQTLSVKTRLEAYQENDEEAEFLHNPKVIAAAEKLTETAIHRARINPVLPIRGHDAERYMAQTHTDIFNTASVAKVTSIIETAGARIHTTGIPTLSVIFFDIADQENLKRITLPVDWVLTKLNKPSNPAFLAS